MNTSEEQLAHYRAMEQGLNELVGALTGVLSPTSIINVRLLLTAGEYGLALEMICEAIEDQRVPISSSQYEGIEALGQRMGMESGTWEGLGSLRRTD